jgi:hypothetical protein
LRRRIVLATFGLILFVSRGLATEPDIPVESGPVGPYSLASVKIEYTEGGLYGSTTTTLSGDGTGMRVSDLGSGRVERRTFSVEPQRVFELLDLCYRKRFFELRDHGYGPPNHLRLRPDGTIDVMATVIADGGGRSIRVTIGNYSKVASYSDPGGEPPAVLVELARRLGEFPIPEAAK